jgi:signal transduction histidine kinase
MQSCASISTKTLLSQRLLLYVGFGSLLLLMTLEAYRASRTLDHIQAANATIRNEIMRRDDVLDGLRSDLFRSNIDIRDYLSDSDPQLANLQRIELEKRLDDTHQRLSQFLSNQDPKESSSGLELQHALTEYWNTLDPIFNWSPEYRRDHGAEFLRQEIVPRRQKLADTVNQITAIDSQQVHASEKQLEAIYGRFARELKLGSLLIIGVGILVGFISIQSVLRLERSSANHYREVVQARAELRRLNASLLAAVEEERRRLSRELHDQVGQHLSAVLIDLGNVESSLLSAQNKIRQKIGSARDLVEMTIAKVRDLALLLRPSMLDDLGLVVALKWHAREVSRRTGIRVEVIADGITEDLPDEQRTCIYRVVQEAVNNAILHGKPHSMRITLFQRFQEVEVSVQDDGAGFDPEQDRGIGILGMKERVESLGGVVQIDSKPGNGCVMAFFLPLAEMPLAGRSS